MWVYRARVLRVVDADTAELNVDLGFSVRVDHMVRLLNVSAPELRQPGGPESRRFVLDWLALLPPLTTWPLMVHTDPNTLAEPTERRTLTRYLATVWDIRDETRSLNEALAEFLAGHPEWGQGT